MVTPDVLAPAGDHFSTPAGQLSYTLGELLIETATAGQNIITEGFHQPDLLITVVPANDIVISSTIFPNPASQFFNIQIVGGTLAVELSVFDPQGKLFLQQRVQTDVTEQVDISTWPVGLYFIRINSTTGKLLHTAKLIRTN